MATIDKLVLKKKEKGEKTQVFTTSVFFCLFFILSIVET